MKPKIILYASVGNNVPSYLIGGGETGTRRTIQLLQGAGYEVEVVDKAIFGLGIMRYIKMIIFAFLKIFSLLVKDKSSLFYIVGYYERNLWFEWLTLTLAKNMGHKCIYEARNGRLVTAFYARSALYKHFMLALLRKADLILCQGQEYVDFIRDKLGKSSIYVPNYVMDDKILPYPEKALINQCRLIYTGRLVESKNICLMLEVVSILKQRKVDVHLDLLGSGQESYLTQIRNQIKTLDLESEVSFTGHISFDLAIPYLSQAHFFLFPSQEIKEGHSNSLTEAMAFGIVPIVSTAGFSANIVNNCLLVERVISAQKYADRILEIIETKRWDHLSHEMYDRAINNYRESIVRENILNAIQKIAQ